MKINLKSIKYFSLFIFSVFTFQCSQLDVYNNALKEIDPGKKLLEISIVTDKATIPNGLSQPLIAYGSFNNLTMENISQYATWTSNNEDVITIENTTNIDYAIAWGVNTGHAIITASMDGVTSPGIEITIDQLTSIDITPSTASGTWTTPWGVDQQFTATGNFNICGQVDITNYVSWTSSDTDIADISASGLVTQLPFSIPPGTVDITATSGTINTVIQFTIDNIIYVSTAGDDITGDGTIANGTPAPFRTIEKALSISAAGYGMEIHVAGGTYTDSIVLKNDVCLYGGYSSDFSIRDSRTFLTTIDPISAAASFYGVAGDGTITSLTVIDGFIINGGNSSTSTTFGILCGPGCSPTITNNRIYGGTGNPASIGIYCDNDGFPLIHHNLINGGESNATAAIYLNNSNAAVHENKIFGGKGAAASSGIAVRGSDGSTSSPVIRNNLIHGGASTYTCGLDVRYNTAIQNNTIYGGTNGGTTSDVSIGIRLELPTGINGVKIQNNIIFCNPSVIGYGIYEAAQSDIVPVDNNNVFDCMTALYRESDGTLFKGTRNGNFFEGGVSLTPAGKGNISTPLDNSMFVNLKGSDADIDTWDDSQSWALSSPAEPTTADGGLQLSNLDTYDFAGNLRTKPWSIGAYENDSSELVAFYPLKGDATDESASNISGKIIDGLSYDSADRYGNTESAFHFDGTGYIEVVPAVAGNTLPLPTGARARTLCTWVRYEDGMNIMHYGNQGSIANGNCGLAILTLTNSIDFYGDSIHEITYPMPSGWIQICAVYNSETARIYINGVYSGTESVISPPWSTVSQVLWIGRSFPTINFFKGSIDEVRIYRRALSAQEIINIYNMEKP